ncbi:DUF1127 domain-containing protein [Serratia fonticola]|uniref:DUF1127 domain-containing protein n=1 Tax=Serratia fonticola TaxID=47917 RepID=UPI0008FED801|nr:DUF1127 domain-containing protein [Serratia fonticola]MBC3379208.1 DUF1127 domain-containing protein [Serratia fonticola]NYA38408.1 DUF1127 domain-containing protein [Serratia fonticola]
MSNNIENQINECESPATRVAMKRRTVFVGLWLKAYRWLNQWNERRKAANTLARLNGDQLKDIGLSRDDIKRDYSRPFWR